jgi:hypothetical protein
MQGRNLRAEHSWQFNRGKIKTEHSSVSLLQLMPKEYAARSTD